jgi:hypothetical protein
MINHNREIRPEDFYIDPDRRCFVTGDPVSEAKYHAYIHEKEELKRLYELQEAAKAQAHFNAEQERKSQIRYSERLCEEICQRVGGGEFLINICRDECMPLVRNVNQWLKHHADFKALYDDAVSDRLNIFEDEIVTIADESEHDMRLVTKGRKAVKVVDPEVISRAKLRVDVRKAHLKAYRPERWGEQSTLNVNNNTNDMDNLSADELDKAIEDLEAKDAVQRVV